MYPKKRFGQNFLTDEKILEDLVRLINISFEDKVLEIGPGKGDLSENIINCCNSYYAVEIDRDLFNLLKAKFPENEKSFINADILKLKPSEIMLDDNFRLVGNIPYNISSPILNWCEKNYEKISDMHFMLQKEFALRCSGNENTSSYGRLSVICKYLYEVEVLKEVSKVFFNPEPKVDSLFVRFYPKYAKIDEKEFQNLKTVTRALFNKKRKKISNSLKYIMRDDDIKKIDLDLNLRPDELSLDDFLRISNLV